MYIHILKLSFNCGIHANKYACEDYKANFLFAMHPAIEGKTLYQKLKQKGVLVRHFDKARISDYVRITVGTLEEMKILVAKISEILEEAK